MTSNYLIIFKNYTCVLIWNDVKVILHVLTLYMYVFPYSNIYYSQSFDLFFVSFLLLFFLSPNIKNWNIFLLCLFDIFFFQIFSLKWLFKVKLPIMVNWLFPFCVYIAVVFFYLLQGCFLRWWRLVFFITHQLIHSSL